MRHLYMLYENKFRTQCAMTKGKLVYQLSRIFALEAETALVAFRMRRGSPEVSLCFFRRIEAYFAHFTVQIRMNG